ncbi:hypothetical protein PENSPDRAFT_650795 [Peniophora sp. CONT]|nr:hypothetical protein PENSPDRAFT_650795 [Peniophora sp. CONT]
MSTYTAHPYAATQQYAYGYQDPYYGQQQQQAQSAYYQQQQAAYYQQQPKLQPVEQPFPAFAGSTPGPGVYTPLPQQQAVSSATRPITPVPAQPVQRRHTSSDHGRQRQSSTHRHASTSSSHNRTASQQARPLRSAMKKTPSKSHGHSQTLSAYPAPTKETIAPVQNVPTLHRARSKDTERPRLDSMRSRTGSSAAAAARFEMIPSQLAHLFVTIKSPDVLEVQNITSADLGAHVEAVCKYWHRTAHVERDQYSIRAKFVGRPFASTGPDLVQAQYMIINLFKTLSAHGYLALTSVHTNAGSTAPRLVFQRDHPDSSCEFLAMCMDPTGMTFVGAADEIVQNLTLHLNGIFRKAFEDVRNADNSYSIRRREGGPSLQPSLSSPDGRSLVFSVILKFMNDEYFKLDASIAFGKTGLFGLGPRKEAWIFKTSPRWMHARTDTQ